ncbi:MAG: type II toxin-antitoxin system HipA family toxin YjjJ [Gemmataceae bacterium]
MEQLLAALRKRGVARSAELQADLGVSQPVVSRLVRAAGERVCRLGRTRGARYAATRAVAGLGTEVPVWRIDDAGRPHRHADLHLLADDRHWLERQDGSGRLCSGLPPFAWDMKPQGYIGRAFPTLYPELGLPRPIDSWGDDQVLVALARRGEDCVGNLIVGEESLNRFLAHAPVPRGRDDYPALAGGTLAGAPGSSAGGEQPKFAVFIGERHLLVKFAGGDGTAAERWRDLLLCEHAALEMLRTAGVRAATSACFDIGDIRFLEMERFDRVGQRGRRGVMSLATVNDHFCGYNHDSWSKAARRLLDEPEVSVRTDDVDHIRWLDTFGELIANTDRHFYNVTFFAEEADRPTLALAPTYDMLPMAFAPRSGVVVDIAWQPSAPTADNYDLWDDAAARATEYWDRLTQRTDLTAGFRAIAIRCRDALVRAAR